jgi:pimeloyl-ACP methyl ester carboxylesterase
MSGSAAHRGGSGTPLVLLHGLNASWRVWRPLLGALEAAHDVLAPTLLGHRGGPVVPTPGPVTVAQIADAVELLLDGERIATAHIAGNSLGGWVALELGRRGRARSVVALSPVGGWERARDIRRALRLAQLGQSTLKHRRRLGLEPLLRRPRSRRMLLHMAMEHGDRIPAREAAELIEDLVCCTAFPGIVGWLRTAAPLDHRGQPAAHPIRIAWAERDRTIPLARFGRAFLASVPGAEHVTMPGVGHVPMYDDPALVARTILDVTLAADRSADASGFRSGPHP